MEDNLKKLYDNLIKDNYDLPEFSVFQSDMQDAEKSQRLHKTLLADNYDLPDYDTFVNDVGIKKKVPSALPLSSLAKGDKSILEVVSGVDFKRPQPKQEGGSLEMSPSPSKAKTVKPEQPKVDYNATNPQSISMLDQIEADNNRVLYKDEKIQTLQGDFEDRVKKEQESLFKKYQSQVEANPDKVETLQAEFEKEAMNIAELRSAEFAKVATDMLGQKEYEYLGKDAGNLSKLFQNILEGGSNAAAKDKQINDITQSVLSTVPEEMRESVQREINGIVMDVAGESDLGSMYLIQKTVTDKMGRLQQAKASIEAKYQEAMANWKDAPAEAISSAYTAGEVMLPTGTSLPKEIQEIQKQRIAINNALNTYEKALKVPTAKSGSGVAAWREAVPDILTVGMAGMIDAVEMSRLVSKQEKGNTTEEEDAIIDAYGSLQTLKGMASQEFNAYRRNQSIAGSVAYLEMMLLTGAQGNIARKIGVDVGKKAVEGKIRNTFIKEVTRRGTRAVVEGAVSAGLRTPLAPATYKGIAEASMGDFKIENGQFVVDETTRPSIVKAIAEGGYNSAVDIFSESLGGIVDVPSKWLTRSLTPTARKAFQSVGLNGLQGEFFEEMAAAAFQGENPFDPELLKDLLITVPAMIGGMGIIASPSTIANANSRAKRKDLIDTFGRDKITAIRDAVQNKNEDALVSIVNEAGIGLIEGGLTPEQAKKKVANLVEYASLYVAQTTKDEVSGAVEAKVEESVGAMPEGLRAQPEATQGELRFEPEVEETKPLTEGNLARTQEIEQLAKNEGYEFEVEADSDSDMTTLNVLDGERKVVPYEELPQGIKTLADEFTQLMHEDEVAIEPQNDVVEPLSPPSDTKVPLTGESALQKGINKETEGISPVQYGRVTIPTETGRTEYIPHQGEGITQDILLDGENAGSVNTSSVAGVTIVQDVRLTKRDSKEGRNIYYSLRDQARQQGSEHISNPIGGVMTTEHSWNVWKSLEKRGEVVRVGNRYVWADVKDKEGLVEKANQLDVVKASSGIDAIKIDEADYATIEGELDRLSRKDFKAKYPQYAKTTKEHTALQRMMLFAVTLDRLNLNNDELLDFVEKTATFVENNKLNGKYGDFRTNVGQIAEYVNRRKAGDGKAANQSDSGGRGRGQDGRGEVEGATKSLTENKGKGREIKAKPMKAPKYIYTVIQEAPKAVKVKIPYWESTDPSKKKNKQLYYETWIPKSIIEKGDDAIRHFVLTEREKKRTSNPYQSKFHKQPLSWRTLGEFAPERVPYEVEYDDVEGRKEAVKQIVDEIKSKYPKWKGLNRMGDMVDPPDGMTDQEADYYDKKIREAQSLLKKVIQYKDVAPTESLTEEKPIVEAPIISETGETTTQGENVPPTKAGEATETKEGGKQREKSYLTRLYNSLKASDRLKKDIEEGGLLYSVMSNVQSSQDADAIIAEMGFEKAELYIRDRNNAIAGSTRNIIANRLGFHYDELASQAEAEGDFEAALSYAERAYGIFNFVDYVGRDGGRFNQIGASAEISGLLTPKRAVVRQKRQIREQRDKELKKAKKEIERLRKQLQEINEKAIDEVLGSQGYQRGRTGTAKMPKVKAKAIADKIRKLKPSSFGLTFADPIGATAVFEGAVELVAKTVELSGNIAEAINKGLEYIRNSAWYKSLKGEQQVEVDDKFIDGIESQFAEVTSEEGKEKKSPTEKLVERIDRMLKGSKPQKPDPVRQMIETLFGKVKEQDTKEKVKADKKSNVEKIREALENKAEYAEVWEAAKKEVEFNIEANPELSDAQKQEYKARLDGFYNEMIGKPYSETQAEGATREAIRDMGIEIDRVVRQHYTVQDATARSLVDKLIEDLGVNAADAKMIAESVQKAFDKIATQRKRTILLQGLKARTKTAGTPKAGWERLLDLTNLGAFSNAEFAEAYADAMGFPKLTEAQAKEMERLAGEIHKWSGFKKHEKIQDYLSYVAKLPGIDMGEVAMGMWYASILSGQRTQFKNILANTANLIAEWFVGTIYNGIRLDGSTVVMMNKGLGAGFGRGITEWRHVMSTGYSSIRDNKIETANYMEQWRFKGGRFNPANWAKYVSRFMIATDAFFYCGLKEMRAHELAMVEAHKRNKEATQPTQSDYALASEILYKTSERRVEAEAQADSEGLKGNERKKRIYDIMDGGRPTEMVAESSYFASKGTFNYKPEGVLGMLTESISDITNKITLRPTIPFTGRTVSIRIGKLFVPFTRIIANVANIALEYTPVGAARAYRGAIGWEALNKNPDKQGFYRQLSKEEQAKTAIRAAIGMIATYALYALSEPGDDGEEPAVRITANGTGDYAKNQQLVDSDDGFQPYSIKIGDRWYSYQYTPLFLALAPIGLIRDNQRYKRGRGEEDVDATDIIGAMLLSTGSALSDMTWLASVSGLLEAFGSGDVGTFTNYLKRTASSVSKGFIYPKAIEQTKQMIDDYYDNPKRFSSNVYGKIVKDMPVISNYFPIQYNMFGDPVTVDAINMLDKGTSDPVASFVGRYWKETGGLSNVRQKSMLVYDVETGKDRIVTDVEFMNYVRVSGQEIGRRLEEELMANEVDMSPIDIGKAIKNIESDVRQKTKAEMFGWREWQSADPKFWQEMIDNRAVQVPVSSKTFTLEGRKKISLTEEQLVEYNKTAMGKYIESLKEYFSDKSEVEDNKTEMYDVTTNTSVYDWRVKGLWGMAREAANWEMIEKIQGQQK